MIVIEIMNQNQIFETLGIRVCLRTENEMQGTHGTSGIEIVTEIVVTMMTEGMSVILRKMPLKDM